MTENTTNTETRDILLRVENLNVYFDLHDQTVHAVRGISFKVARGETLALVGESGSGKSVTSMSVMRLLDEKMTRYGKDSRITFEGTSILDADAKTLRNLRGGRIAFIFQEPMTSLNPFMRIGRQLMEAALLHNKDWNRAEARKRVLELLQRVGIREAERRMKQYPHEFSGGQLQRVMIAMALINNPDLLIADEPTTALDVTIQAEILDLLHDLQKQMGMAIIFITHDLGLAEHYSKTVCVMRHGEIVERGKIKQVFAEPKHEYTRELIHSIPTGVREPVKGDPDVLIDAKDVRVEFVLEKNFFGKPTKVFKAVKGLNVKIRRGETLGIVGESGSGKSTFGKAVMQMLPYTGEISFEGRNLRDFSKEEARRLKAERQIVFQDPYGSLSPRLTVGEIVGEGFSIHQPQLSKKERIERVLDVLDEVSLPTSALNRYPHEFSGGQRQRIAIARAVILRPKFILLDEPTSALNRSVQVKVVELLCDLQDKYGLTYMFISHDLSVVRAVSNNVIVMQLGEMMEYGTSEQIFSNPQTEYTQRLVNAAFDL
ncbi:oligopeptide/dipeptide ABC superfamily ATP binding cassette transporter, ABC protein [Neisseria bacilliformis ATCC BAA-1200]|uniref:Oligopeptide/dipeptide ABC superfamily ATP binding cassette transporter, ABC protein n=1 Tax=Neisseria bacilliformis ATCC BAA-1200 TaxID=888742 RepID=F2BE11_9NEIS|nr:ABC transporter ATP-binding protein [Neisseria bacilliformis]EGF10330.1 oligopeptide/dipeptide ABC superfamily ATP binding cassette transporter, ABC protein [Neisseria bacilliformis ATCC BAA-1200]QMT46713.1 ABC transporter ATP-binding protein [Neisseria bacilliformis]